MIAPWELHLYSLVSWWDMEKFSASVFLAIAKYLADVRSRIEKIGPTETTVAAGQLKDDSSGYRMMQAMKSLCGNVGLRVSVKCVDYIFSQADKEITVKDAMGAISQLERTIKWEMEDKLFMYIPPQQAERYDQPELFGKEVNAKFPSVQFDVVEAGNCYALGRSTACVFHLMRVMEVGVQQFGAKLGVTLSDTKNWQTILNETNKAVTALDPKKPETVLFSEISANLYAVKLAWRNEVMHPKDTYTLEEADGLIRLVKIFMGHLARVV